MIASFVGIMPTRPAQRTPAAAAQLTEIPSGSASALRPPIMATSNRTRSPCCARTAIGHAAAAPPTSVMKSRRFISFDDLVGDSEQPVWNLEAERLGGLEVDHEREFDGLHHREIGRLLAFENPPGIDAGLAIRPPASTDSRKLCIAGIPCRAANATTRSRWESMLVEGRAGALLVGVCSLL